MIRNTTCARILGLLIVSLSASTSTASAQGVVIEDFTVFDRVIPPLQPLDTRPNYTRESARVGAVPPNSPFQPLHVRLILHNPTPAMQTASMTLDVQTTATPPRANWIQTDIFSEDLLPGERRRFVIPLTIDARGLDDVFIALNSRDPTPQTLAGPVRVRVQWPTTPELAHEEQFTGIAALQFSEDFTAPGESGQATVRYRYVSSAPPAPFTVTLYERDRSGPVPVDRLVGTAIATPTLAPGQMEEVTILFQIPSTFDNREHEFFARLDDGQALAESDELDNETPIVSYRIKPRTVLTSTRPEAYQSIAGAPGATLVTVPQSGASELAPAGFQLFGQPVTELKLRPQGELAVFGAAGKLVDVRLFYALYSSPGVWRLPTGSPPNRRLIYEYKDHRSAFQGPPDFSGQIHLLESGTIELHYDPAKVWSSSVTVELRSFQQDFDQAGPGRLTNRPSETLVFETLAPALIDPTPGIDLAASLVGTPYEVHAGTTESYDIIVRNLGTRDSGPFRVTVERDEKSANGFVDRVIRLATFDLPGLAAGASSTQTFSISAPAGTVTHVEQVFIHVDSEGQVSEHDRGNNFSSVLTTIHSANNPAYTIESLPVGMTSILGLPGTTTVFDNAFQRVREGQRPLNLPFAFEFFGAERGELFADVNGLLTYDELPPSLTSDTITSLPFPSRPNLLMAGVWDDLELQPGVGSILRRVSGTAPDRVLTVEFRDLYKENGSRPVVTFQIKLFESTNVIEFHYDDSQDWTGENLAASIGLEGEFSARAVSLGAAVSVAPTENTRMTPIPGASLPVAPDLELANLDLAPTLSPGQTYSATLDIINRFGPAGLFTVRAVYSVDGRFDPADTVVGEVRINGLPTATTLRAPLTIQMPSVAPAGSLIIFVDADFEVDEVFEQGNTLFGGRTLILLPLPDLSFDFVGLGSPSLSIERLNALTLRLSTGPRAIPGSVGITATLTPTTAIDLDQTIFRTTLSTTRTGYDTTYPLQIPASTPPGSYILSVIADQEGLITESDLSNNVTQLPVTVLPNPRPNLVGSLAALQPQTVRPGESLSADVTLTNAGNSSVSATTFRLLLSADTIADPSDTVLAEDSAPTLSAGQSTTIARTLTVPASTATGAWHLLLMSDATDDVLELDETDNLTSAIFVVGDPTGPDLRPTALAVSPSPLMTGLLTVSGTITNQGTVSAAATTTELRLSRDTTPDPGDTLLHTESMSPVLALPYSFQVSVPVPASVLDGPWNLLAVVDPLDLVIEANEVNNVAVVPVVIARNPLDAAAGSIFPAQTAAAPGQALTVSRTITNLGRDPLPALSVGYYLSADAVVTTADLLIGRETIPTIPAGAQAGSGPALITVPVGTAPGAYVLAAIVDDTDAITESDESNNTSPAVAFLVSIPPVNIDLQAGAPVSSTSTPTAGQTFSLTRPITNLGSTAAGPFDFDIVLSTDGTIDPGDRRLLQASLPGLGASSLDDSAVTITIPVDATLGPAFLGLLVDSADAIGEGNELNNARTLAVDIQPSDQLDLSAISTLPAGPFQSGDTIPATALINNAGPAFAATFSVGLYLSTDPALDTGDLRIASATLSGLAPGATATLSLDGVLPLSTGRGLYQIGVIVDDGAAVLEQDETNNVDIGRSITVVTPAVIELEATALSLSAPSLLPGEDLTWTRTVTNLGLDPAAGVRVGLYLSTDATITTADTLLDSATLPSVAPGAPLGPVPRTVRLPAGLPTGPVTIGLFVDDNDAFAEFDESNNVFILPFTVIAPPAGVDLVVEALSSSTAQLRQGESLTLTRVLRNLGDTDGPGFTFAVVISPDTTLDATDPVLDTVTIAGLAAVSREAPTSRNITIPAGTAPGTYTIGLIVDSTNAVTEADEGNNTRGLSLDVQLAFTPGDVNNDGTINVIDVQAVIAVALGQQPTHPAADIDGDGDVDVSDVQATIGLALGP